MMLPDSYAFQQRQGFILVEIFYLSHFLNLLYHKLFSLSSIFLFFWGCSSCRPPSRASGLRNYPLGSHLYSAQQDSARWGLRDRSRDSAVSRAYRLTWVTLFALPYLPSPFVYLLQHTLWGLSRTFFRFLIFFVGLGFFISLNLTSILQQKIFQIASGKNVQNFGRAKGKICAKFPLDKMHDMWYNEKIARARSPARHAEIF